MLALNVIWGFQKRPILLFLCGDRVALAVMWICDWNMAKGLQFTPTSTSIFRLTSFVRLLLSRVWTGSTGKATSTRSSSLRWRSGHPTSETWREGGNDHKRSNQHHQHCYYSVWTPHKPPWLPHPHTLQRPKPLPRALLPPRKTNTPCPPLYSLTDQPRLHNPPPSPVIRLWKCCQCGNRCACYKLDLNQAHTDSTHAPKRAKTTPSHLILILSLVLQRLWGGDCAALALCCVQ